MLLWMMLLVVYGCTNGPASTSNVRASASQTATMRYRRDLGEDLLLVKSGDTFAPDIVPQWLGGSPCDMTITTSNPTCKITNEAKGITYRYNCPDKTNKPCDPDILVDDGVDIQTNGVGRTVSTAAVSAAIAIYCDSNSNQTALDPPDAIHIHQGDTLGWAVVGDADTGNITWHLTFMHKGTDEMSLCGSSNEINEANPTCKAQSTLFEMNYRYQATVNACTISTDKPMARIKPSKKPS
jgi:hypothetical protein